MLKRYLNVLLLVIVFLALLLTGLALASSEAAAASPMAANSSMPWWAWPLILFVVTFLLGIVAVLGGV
jgi:hypothetical protein